jgi:hypothetical protein
MARKKEEDRIPVREHSRRRPAPKPMMPPEPTAPPPEAFGLASPPGEGNMPRPMADSDVEE